MAASTSMLHIRIDDAIKTQASDTLAAMGLSMSEAVRLFLHRVVAEQAFPLELKVPNAQTRQVGEQHHGPVALRKASRVYVVQYPCQFVFCQCFCLCHFSSPVIMCLR